MIALRRKHIIVLAVTLLVIAGGVHTAKSAVIRPAVTATTGGAGNVPVSILEDITASVVSFFSIIIPLIIAITLIVIMVVVGLWWNRSKAVTRAQP